MEYTHEIVINRPRDQVADLFEDPESLHEWQPEFIRTEHKSGEPGKKGAQSVMVYKRGPGTMEITEIIQVNNLPDEYIAVYETNDVVNTQHNRFIAEGDATRWILDSTFEFKGFMRIMGALMPGQFRKQTLKTMEAFKAFAERT